MNQIINKYYIHILFILIVSLIIYKYNDLKKNYKIKGGTQLVPPVPIYVIIGLVLLTSCVAIISIVMKIYDVKS